MPTAGVFVNGPETRISLLMRLQDPSQQRAWDEFAELYEPLIYRVAVKKGLQHADAQDLTQEVFSSVGQAIKKFDFDSSKGSFRGWLHQITRNLVINFLTRGPRVRGSGDTQLNLMLNEIPFNENSINSESSEAFNLAYKRELFRWSAKRVEAKVKPKTWQAFWLTAVEGIAIEEAAKELELSKGAVRIARCRVMSRLKAELKFYESDESNFCGE